MDLGLVHSSAFWKAWAGLCVDARAANVAACVRQRTEAAVVSTTWEKLLRETNGRGIVRSQQAQIIVMLQCPEPTMAFSLKAKKNKALQMSMGHTVLYNLYPTPSANSRTCNNTEIPPTAKVPLMHPDQQWLVNDTDNKKSCVPLSKLANESKVPEGTHTTRVVCHQA